MMGRTELCAWLRVNSSGIYRPAADAADEIERLAAAADQHFAQAMENGGRANEMREALQVARGALADIATSADMTLVMARKKAERVYIATAPRGDVERGGVFGRPNDQFGMPLEDALKRAYYYDDSGQWRGPEINEWARWHAVAKVALSHVDPLAPAVSRPVDERDE